MDPNEQGRDDLRAEIALLRREIEVLREERPRLCVDAEDSAEEILDIAPVMILLLDRHGRVRSANQAAHRFIGDGGAATGRFVGGLLACRNVSESDGFDCEGGPGCEGCDLRVLLRDTFETGQGQRGKELQLFLGSDGGETNLLASTSLLQLQGDHQVMLCLEDITEQRQAEAKARKAVEILQDAQRVEAVGRLAGGVAQDFNNLLTAIIGHARLAMDGTDPADPMWPRLDGIYWAGKRAASLTGQLLAFSRRQMLQKRVRDLNPMVEQQAVMIGRLLGKGISVSLALDKELPSVEVDANQLAQVILNLVVNAREAMPEGGEIALSTERVILTERACSAMPDARAGEFVCLTVEDTGVGMAPETLSMIFEPFYTTKEGNTGMGLPVVHGLVRQHDGWLHISSAPAQGTRVCIYLPASDREGGPAPLDSAERPLKDFRPAGERILVVEDEETLLELATIILRERGFEVYPAANATDAQAMFDRERGRFDLIFSDVVLPDGNGVELTRSFIAARPGLPVLLTSGYADHHSRWHEIQDRGLDFMRKPYTPSELLQRVRDLLGDD